MNASASDDFSKVDGVMETLGGAQEGACTAIMSAYSLVTPAQLGFFAAAMGPLGVANFTPAFFEATFNNLVSGTGTALNHGLLGASTTVAQAGYSAVDSAT